MRPEQIPELRIDQVVWFYKPSLDGEVIETSVTSIVRWAHRAEVECARLEDKLTWASCYHFYTLAYLHLTRLGAVSAQRDYYEEQIIMASNVLKQWTDRFNNAQATAMEIVHHDMTKWREQTQ